MKLKELASQFSSEMSALNKPITLRVETSKTSFEKGFSWHYNGSESGVAKFSPHASVYLSGTSGPFRLSLVLLAEDFPVMYDSGLALKKINLSTLSFDFTIFPNIYRREPEKVTLAAANASSMLDKFLGALKEVDRAGPVPHDGHFMGKEMWKWAGDFKKAV
jgi:hypothetical protein